MCLGLHTGRVVVDRLGEDPQRLYTASGETTQVAMRLRQLAAPGTILLSAATQHLVQEDVWVEPQGEVTGRCDPCAGAGVRCPGYRPAAFGGRRPRRAGA